MKRPYIVINCAMSADGKIASPAGKQMRISCEEDIQRMYKLRNESDAVLVGINTVLSDDPKLTVKEKYVKNPKQPIRIVLDTYCKTPANSLVVNDVSKTLIITSQKCSNKYHDNVEIIQCKSKNGLIDLKEFLNICLDKKINKLMVEGGGKVIFNFLKSGFVNDIFFYIGPIVIGGENTPSISGVINNLGNIPLKLINVKKIGPGILLHYKLIK